MATQVSYAGAPARRYRRVPWSPRAWGEILYLAGAIPALLIAPMLVVVPVLGVAHNAAVLVLPALVLLVLAVPLLSRMHRQRLRAVAGVVIPRQSVVARGQGKNGQGKNGIVAVVRSQPLWRQLGYHLLVGPALAVAAAGAAGLWLVGTLFTFSLLYAWRLPHQTMLARGAYPVPDGSPLRLLGGQLDAYLTVVGVAALLAAPWVTAGVRAVDASAARALLGPSRAEELEHRVDVLTQTRAGVVDAADAERRRLERDLHDGTQQRLVSLAMNLGMARTQATTGHEARQAIAEAHEEAKAALAELRDLIRGLHPAVLEDRGLDAALSGVVARLPVPVKLTVDLPRRPPPVIEAVAYFVVSEGLANIAKHAQASQAEVFVQRSGDRLHIIISDDGVGGADPARGTGLAGLERRASSVDGTFEISSPPGGPTLLTVDLPCVR
jgi:signal transduction histidine kinase